MSHLGHYLVASPFCLGLSNRYHRASSCALKSQERKLCYGVVMKEASGKIVRLTATMMGRSTPPIRFCCVAVIRADDSSAKRPLIDDRNAESKRKRRLSAAAADDDDDEGNVAQISELNERGTNKNALLIIDVWYKIKFGWGKVQIMYAATRNVQTLPSTKEFAEGMEKDVQNPANNNVGGVCPNEIVMMSSKKEHSTSCQKPPAQLSLNSILLIMMQ